MKRFLLTMLGFSFVVSAIAQAPDPPISPAQAVSMLGKGILLEPEAGNVKLGFSAKYKPAYGDTIKNAGFQSVRIRYQGSNNPMMEAIASGPPYGPKVDSLLDQTDSIITDLLNKNLAVVLTFYGLTSDQPGDLAKMVSWWGYVAKRFRNKSHRLLFDLFVEPWTLVKNNDPHRIMDYYDSITKEIRKTNPDRILIYFKIPPTFAGNDPYGPGTEYFMTKSYNPVPEGAGHYFMWDFHVLKPDARDNIRLVQQAWEYMDSTKQVVWSGAWNAKNTGNAMWCARPMAILTTRRFIDRGIASAYLMFFDGKTSLYEVDNDLNHNGKLNEWAFPGFQKILTSGPDIWWNMLSNPGFEEGMKKWIVAGGTYAVKLSNENHFLQIPKSNSGPVTVSQDVTLALKNNGPGKYDVLAYISSRGNSTVQFILKGKAGGSSFQFESHPQTIYSGHPQLIHQKINARWAGNLEQATFRISVSGDTCTLDKTGLTQFYYSHPKLNISLWPGEKVHQESYSMKSNSVLNLNQQIRNLMNQAINQKDSTLISLADKINDTTKQLENRLVQLIGANYQFTPAGTQFRLGGYYQGSANNQYTTIVQKYIGGKDALAYKLNNALINLQNQARDDLILHNVGFRSFFYDVFRGYPPSITSRIPIDTTVSINRNRLTADQSGAVYQWCNAKNLYNPVGGATKQSFSPDSSGEYAVQIKEDGYTVISGSHAVSLTTGVPEQTKKSKFIIYPNPAKNFIILESKEVQCPFEMKILDMQGHLLQTYKNLHTPVRIPLHFPSGFYIGEVIFHNSKTEFKLVKQ